ncbi:hypothetical protein [Natronorubrum sulfidifaciens]|uniref:Uncharacterized protein n=1 Tax=Natronorubrum sulfidifaciens JCM 14089 TaxID=1230460 RepID=L9W9H9_9EURY|nr:hypothetical protein [Natronorubrum sulfidifaciens]ELY44978.1 hypothetical protein C495_08545 [Natronorubrum sulfidifaciens JCM 14089]
MRRRFEPWFGGGLLVLTAGFLAVFGHDAFSDPITAALLSGLAAAATLSIIGGTVDSIPVGSRRLSWNVFLGIADIILALVLVLSSVHTLQTGGIDALLFATAATVGAGSLVWMGLQTARGSRYVDLEAEPSRARLVAITALAIGSMVVGSLLVTVI